MQIKFDAEEEVAKLVRGYAAEEGITQKKAINDLIRSGWTAKHGDLLQTDLMDNLDRVMSAIAAADARDREDEAAEMAAAIEDNLLGVKAAAIACMLFNGGTEDLPRMLRCYEEAIDIALGRI